jgi:prolyl 4-hydroxylase
MKENCAPYCRACDERCYYNENGPDSWKEPGDLDKTFRRIISWTASDFDTTYDQGGNDEDDKNNERKRAVQILSSPDDKDEGPWIVTVDNFISVDEAARFIELGSMKGYHRSELIDEGVADIRTSSNTWCDYESSCKNDSIVERVARRISDLIGIDESYSEDFQLLKYEEGQLYVYVHIYTESVIMFSSFMHAVYIRHLQYPQMLFLYVISLQLRRAP